jgi:hypothetical protein
MGDRRARAIVGGVWFATAREINRMPGVRPAFQAAKVPALGMNRMRFGLFAILAWLTGCAASPDAHIPPFARAPFQALTAEAVVGVALREWRLFGARTLDDSGPAEAERAPGLWQRVGEYWWLGLNNSAPEASWTGIHGDGGVVFSADRDGAHAWSAAFVSYVLRIAGAGPRFPYAPDHATYINAVKRGEVTGFIALDPETTAPRSGDLLCRGRERARAMRFVDLPSTRFPSHCDIVVGMGPDHQLAVVGGNVADTVTRRLFPLDGAGRLAEADPPWLALLRIDAAP